MIGFWESEGVCGKIADNLQKFFEFAVNCPYWQDDLDEDEYQNQEELRAFAREVYEEHMEHAADLCGFDLPEAQRELAERMGLR